MAGTRCILAAVMAILFLVVRSEYQTPKTLKQSAISQCLKAIPVGSVLASALFVRAAAAENKGKLEYQPALKGLDYGKPRTYYPDYTQKPSGLQYKAVTEGTGLTPKKGDRVVVDWEGYTIGYYGRPFQTRNKVKGGAFESSEKEYFRWVLGSGTVVGALDEAVQYMKEVWNEIPFFICDPSS
jgi:FKBP-type peptidyl-prolyl cis-trans isomerase